MGDVVPDDVVGVGVQRALDVVGVLGGEVTIDDVDDGPPISSLRIRWDVLRSTRIT